VSSAVAGLTRAESYCYTGGVNRRCDRCRFDLRAGVAVCCLALCACDDFDPPAPPSAVSPRAGSGGAGPSVQDAASAPELDAGDEADAGDAPLAAALRVAVP
jgi:hypothetical protein